MRRFFPCCSAILLAAVVSAVCFGAPSGRAAQPPAGSPKSPAVATQAAIPVPKMPVGYNYNPRGKADPFKPFMETDAEVIKKKAEELQKKKMQVRAEVVNPLQKGDIGKFLLVGISGDVKRRTAIVEDRAAKRHYPIFVGTYIGQNGGKVAEIRADRVIVEESVADDQKKSGNKQGMNRIEMLLHREGDK